MDKFNHDITHCTGKECLYKERCVRYMAYKELLDTHNSYPVSTFIEPPLLNEICKYYWKLSDYERSKDL